MQHHHSPDEQISQTPRQYTSAAAPAVVEAPRDPRIEDFLDRVFARLVPILPYEERRARREAMRIQIQETAAAHIELGSAEEEALSLALAQVQREHAAAGQAVQQVQQARTRTSHASARAATMVALGFFGLFYVLDQTRAAGHLWNHWFGPLYEEDGTSVMRNQAVASFYRFELLVLPIISGLATGLLSRARPVRGTLNALALLAVPAIVWGGLLFGLDSAGLWNPQWPEWLKSIFPNPIPAVCGVGCWALLGGLGAGAGGWLRRVLPRAGIVRRAFRRAGRNSVKKTDRSIRMGQET